MITLIASWYCWALLIANVFMVGMCVGQWDAFRIVRKHRGNGS